MAFFYSHPLTTAFVLTALAYGIAGVAILKRPGGRARGEA